jgi:hypothetical protein
MNPSGLAADESHQVADFTVFELDVHFKPTLSASGQQPAGGFEFAESLRGTISAGRLAGEPDEKGSFFGGAWRDGYIRIHEVHGGFSPAEFKVDASIAELDLGQAGDVGSDIGCDGALEERHNVPGTGGRLHDVDTGLDEPKPCKLDAARKKRAKPDSRFERGHVRKGLDTSARIIVDDDIFDSEAWPREEVEGHVADLHFAVQASLHRLAYLLPVSIGANEWRCEAHEEHEGNA